MTFLNVNLWLKQKFYSEKANQNEVALEVLYHQGTYKTYYGLESLNKEQESVYGESSHG